MRLVGPYHLRNHCAAKISIRHIAQRHKVFALVGETVADIRTPKSIQRSIAKRICIYYPPRRVGADSIVAVDKAIVRQFHPQVTIRLPHNVHIRLVVADVDIDLGRDRLDGIKRRSHHTHKCLLANSVALIRAFTQNKIGQRRHIDTGIGHPRDRTEMDRLHIAGIQYISLVALRGHVPLVRIKPLGRAERVDNIGTDIDTARRVDGHRLIVARNISIDRVEIVDAVAGVHLDADLSVQVVAQVDGHLGPRLVSIRARARNTVARSPARRHLIVVERRSRNLVPKTVVDGLVGPRTVVVLGNHTYHKLAGIVGRMAETPRHDGKIDEKQ